MSESNFTQAENGTTTTPDPADSAIEPIQLTKLRVIFAPLSVIIIIFILSSVVYVMIRKKRLDQLRHHLVPLYNFDPGECEDWEAELLEESSDQRLQKKMQDYKSMSSPTATTQH